MSIFETSTPGVSAVSAESSVGKAVSTRSNIFEMTQLAESAVLRPMEYGMFPHEVRRPWLTELQSVLGNPGQHNITLHRLEMNLICLIP